MDIKIAQSWDRNNYILKCIALKQSRLVDWLRVLTPMRENCIRTWVEVVGSVMKKSFQSSMKCEKYLFLVPPCVKHTESKQLTRGKPDV